MSTDTMTNRVRNADPSCPDDRHNGRSSIPIAQCISLPQPYPSRGTERRLRIGKIGEHDCVFGGPFAVKGKQSVLSQVYETIRVDGEHW